MVTTEHGVFEAADKFANLKVGDKVSIHSGYTYKQIGTGTIKKVLKRWVEVETSIYARPVRYRTQSPMKGIRIIGGVAEFLNDYIKV